MEWTNEEMLVAEWFVVPLLFEARIAKPTPTSGCSARPLVHNVINVVLSLTMAIYSGAKTEGSSNLCYHGAMMLTSSGTSHWS